MRQKIIDKIHEKIDELSHEDLMDFIGLDIYSVIEAAVEQELSKLTDEQLLELLCK